MSGGTKYAHKFEGVIVAMLTTSTIQQAAKQANVAEGTIRRWLQREDFTSAYHETRRRTFEAALAQLQGLTGAAVDTLRQHLTSSKPSVAVRCAEIILVHAQASAEMLDLADRLTRIETWLQTQERR